MEGQNLQHLKYGTSGAQQLTASFWVKSSVAAVFGINMYSSDGVRIIGSTYTINSANTWEYKTVTFAGDTGGTINNDNGDALYLGFVLAAGSDMRTTDNTSWGSYSSGTLAYGHTAAANAVMTTSGATWQITGVCLNVGDSAIDFPHESYGETLARCKRYFERIGIPAGSNYQSFGVGHVHTSAVAVAVVSFEVEKRVSPTASYDTGSNFAVLNASGGSVACTSVSTSRITTHLVSVTANSSGLVAGNATFLIANNTAKPFIDIDAEL